MCIGKYSGAEGDASPDFNVLRSCRDAAAAELGVSADTLALSMGMSHDFEQACGLGATHVRVGSTIFGARPPRPGQPTGRMQRHCAVRLGVRPCPPACFAFSTASTVDSRTWS